MSIILNKGNVPSDISADIRARLTSGKWDTFLCLVPTNRKVRQLTREFIEIAPSGVVRGLKPRTTGESTFHIYTLDGLITKLYRVCGDSKTLISDAIQVILFNDITSELELSYFKSQRLGDQQSVSQGTIVQLAKAINRLKAAGIYPEHLEFDLSESDAEETQKLSDIVSIYKAYEDRLGDDFSERSGLGRAAKRIETRANRLFIDKAGIHKVVAEWLSKDAARIVRRVFPRVDIMAVSGFDVFSEPDFEIVSQISSVISTCISLDFNEDNPMLFAHLMENYHELLNRGFSLAVKVDESRQKAYLSQNLFNKNREVERADFKGQISLLNAENRVDEVETIAKLIKYLSLKDGYTKLDKICITFYRVEEYERIIREIFPIYRIPANITTGFQLANSPVVVSILSLLEAVEDNFNRRDVLRTIKSPYLQFAHADGDEIDDGNLISVARNLKITDGADNWRRIIEERFNALSETAMDEDSDGFREKREIIELEKARKDIEAFFDLLSPFNSKLTPDEFKTQLLATTQKLKLTRQILSVKKGKRENGKTRKRENGTGTLSQNRDERHTRAYARFVGLLEDFTGFLKSQYGEDKRGLSFYLNQLKLAISQTTFNTREKPGYGVQIMPIIETKGLDFDVLILGGLVDGEFPLSFRPDVFLNQKRARKESDRLLEDRFLFYQAISNYNKHLYLIYPRKDGETELVRSPFVDELCRIVEMTEDAPPDLEEIIFSEESLLKWYGAHADNIALKQLNLNGQLTKKLDSIQHNIAVQSSRGKTIRFAPTSSNGIMPEFEGRIFDALKENDRVGLAKLKTKIYSTSQLETYGRCPFRYFAQRVLLLNSPMGVDEELAYISALDYREHGGLMHRVLYKFYSRRRDKKSVSECDDAEFEEAMDDITSAANEEIDELNLSGLFWQVDTEKIVGGHGRKGILRTFLESERKKSLQVVPEHFEVRFGCVRESDGDAIHAEPVFIGNVMLRGIIDRVEIGDGIFVVADYKTGSSIPGIDDILEGRSLQLPIYLHVLEHIFREKIDEELKGVAGVYYVLRDECRHRLGIGDKSYKDKAFAASSSNSQLLPNPDKNAGTLDEVVKQTVDRANSFVEAISRGEFPLTLHQPEKVCGGCDFKLICRIGAIEKDTETFPFPPNQ